MPFSVPLASSGWPNPSPRAARNSLAVAAASAAAVSATSAAALSLHRRMQATPRAQGGIKSSRSASAYAGSLSEAVNKQEWEDSSTDENALLEIGTCTSLQEVASQASSSTALIHPGSAGSEVHASGLPNVEASGGCVSPLGEVAVITAQAGLPSACASAVKALLQQLSVLARDHASTAVAALSALLLSKGHLTALGPMNLSLVWGPNGPFGRPPAVGRGGGGEQGLDLLDRALLRLGAWKYGWRPPTSLSDRIVILNCAVFALDFFMHRRLTVLGAKENTLIRMGQVWRLFTPALLHGGVFHLVMNCTALRNIGPTMERLLGRKRFLTLYVFSAFTGTAMSMMLSPAPSVGASGAIFGLLGAFAAFAFRLRTISKTEGRRDIFPALARTVMLNLLIGAVPPNNIDNWGHVGGLLGGALLMLYYIHQSESRQGKKLAQ